MERATITELIDYEAFCGIPPPLPVAAAETHEDEISATELKRRLDKGEDLQIIDLREPYEYEFARIPNTTLVPLGQVLSRMSEIDASRQTIVHCKMCGHRAKAIEALKGTGFYGRLLNLRGSITA